MPDEPEMQPDLNFLSRFLHKDQFLEFRLKAEGADGLAERFFTTDLAEVARRITDPNLHVWFGVVNRRSGESGDESNLGYAHFLYVDLDHIDANEALDRIVREAELPMPTLMVNSGHGIHAYWELDPPLDLSKEENLERFRRAERAISAAVGGDERAKDAARVLRVPGTWNPKEPRAFCHQVKRGHESYPIEIFDPGTGQDKLVWIWRHTKVHQLSLGIAGWCYHKGISQEDAEALISEVASEAKDPEIGDRLRCVRDAYEGGAQGKQIAYKPHLESRMGQLVLEALEEIWGKRPEGGPLIPVVEGKQYVQPTTTGVDYLWRKQLKDAEIWTRAHVISAPLRYTGAYDVEGRFAVRSWYQDRMGVVEEIVDFDTLPNMLKARGLVMRERLLRDTLGALRHYHINNGIRIMEAHPAIGAYGPDFDLSLEEAIPLTTPQEMMKSAALEKRAPLRKEVLEAYVEVQDFFEPWEVLPIMGLGAIAPFLFQLKVEKAVSMVPTIFIVGPHGLGKTTLNAIFTSNFYGVLKITGKAIDTQFRLDDYLNSMTFPLHVEEGEDIDFKTHAPKLKAAAESAFLSSKGKPSREQDVYKARCVMFLDGNKFPIQDWNLMMRFILIEMEEGAREERHRKADKFDRVMARLEPLGIAFFEHLRDWMKASAESAGITASALLANTIRKNKEKFSDLDYVDIRRSTLWAIIYTGLQLWEKVCKDHGIAFSVSEAEFRKKVIIHLEKALEEARPRLLGERFRDWWVWYLARNTRTTRIGNVEIREIQGDGEYFIQDDEAWYISQPAIEPFERGEYKLSDIARALAEVYHCDKEYFYNRKTYKQMGSGRRRVLRLPKDIEAEVPIESFDRRGRQETFTSQVEQYQKIRAFFETNPGWHRPEEVSTSTGVSNVLNWLTRLVKEGHLESREGSFRLLESGAREHKEEASGFQRAVELARNIRRSDPRRPASFIVRDLMEELNLSREEAEGIVHPLFDEGDDQGEENV